MKLVSLTIVTVFVAAALVSPATVSAVTECTAKQTEFMDGIDFSDLDVKCPTIFTNVSGINTMDINTITAKSLMAISPCQSPECTRELAFSVGVTYDCFENGFNLNRVYRALFELCTAISAGEVTVSEAKEIFRDAGIPEAGGEDGSSETAAEADSSTTTEEPVTEVPATQETPAATKPDTADAVTPATPVPTVTAAPTLAPTPVPTSAPSSSATRATAIMGVAVTTTATLVASLLL